MKNQQKGSVGIILLAIVVVVLLGVIGWMYFKQPVQVNQVSDTSSTAGNQQNVTTNTSNPVQPENTATDNKAYNNTQYGFSFQYPKGDSVTDGKPNSQTVGVWFVWLSDKNQNTVVGINVYQSNLTLDQFVANEKQTLSVSPTTVSFNEVGQVSLGGNTATKVNYSFSGRNSGMSEIYYFKKNGLVYRIQLNSTIDTATKQNILMSFNVK